MRMRKKVEFDYSKLRGRIVEKYGSITRFADALGISKSALSVKLNNHRLFTQDEIYRAIILLDIEHEATEYFFTVKVTKR